MVRARTVMVTTAIAGMELTWLCMLLGAATLVLRVDVSIPLLLLFFAVSFTLSVGLRAAGLSRHTATVLNGLVWPVATLLILKVWLYPHVSLTDASWLISVAQEFSTILYRVEPTVFVGLSSILLWWLGARLANAKADFPTAVAEFQIGLMILAAVLFIGYMLDVDQPGAIPAAVVFVGLGLVGAASAHTEDEGGWLFALRYGPWWGMLLTSVGLVLLVGLLAGVLFTPELMQFVARGIRSGWELFERLLDALAGLFGSTSFEMEPASTTGTTLAQDGGESFSLGLPNWILRPGRIIYGILVAGLLLLALGRIASQLFGWMRQKANGGRAEMESLPGAFRLDLLRLFRHVFSWLVRITAFVTGRKETHHEPAETTSVRRLYVDMLRWGAEAGHPRDTAQTPFEYQQVLCVALPAYRADVALITQGYVRARYGARPPTEAELHDLKESRRRLTRRAAPVADSDAASHKEY